MKDSKTLMSLTISKGRDNWHRLKFEFLGVKHSVAISADIRLLKQVRAQVIQESRKFHDPAPYGVLALARYIAIFRKCEDRTDASVEWQSK